MAAPATDNWFNVVEYYVAEALKLDPDLKAAGPLAITTWEAEPRDSPALYNDNELPAISCECLGLAGLEETSVPEGTQVTFSVVVWITCTGGARSQRRLTVKEYAARVVRCLLQQHAPTKQFASLPSALDWAESGGVQPVVVVDVGWDAGDVESVAREVAAVRFLLPMAFQITLDS